MHLSQAWMVVPGLARRALSRVYEVLPGQAEVAGDSLIADLWDLGSVTSEGVRTDPERDVNVLAGRIEVRAQEFFRECEGRSPDERQAWMVEGSDVELEHMRPAGGIAPRGPVTAGSGRFRRAAWSVSAAAGQHEEMDDDMADAAEALRGHKLVVDIEGRRIRLVEPAKGDPGNAVLRTLGLVESLSPVGAAAYGPAGVAAGVWRDPELYMVRWTKGRRWVVGYRLGDSRPNHYVRTEGRIPTRFETGNWYGDVPEEVDELFLAGDLLLDDPPFPLPPPPPPPTPSRTPAPRTSRVVPARKPRTASPRAAASPKTSPPATRLCPSCRMHKAPGQFVAGSELCVDCR